MTGSHPTIWFEGDDMKRPGCYECKYEGHAVYSAHCRCQHPMVAGQSYGAVGMAAFLCGMEPLGVTGNKHGIDHGWFLWPLDFDPVWLESCEGFAPKEKGGDEVEQAK
jgi:hypothetical protein